MEAQLRTLKEKPTEVKAPDAPKTETKADAKPIDDPEPNRADEPQKWLEWKIRQQDRLLEEQGKSLGEIAAQRQKEAEERRVVNTYTEAIGEFNKIRDEYITKNPDYVPAFKFAYDKYASAAKLMNPALSDRQIIQQIDQQLLIYAGECYSKGLNPAEELYDLAIERFGYVPNSAKEDAPEEEEAAPRETEKPARVKERPNLRTITSNKRRAASPLMGPGQGGRGALTKEAAANMTLGEMVDLGPEDWAELERLGA